MPTAPLTTTEYFDALRDHWVNEDEIVVCALGTSSSQWYGLTGSDHAFYVNAAMGFASSFALGLALACPGQRVLMLDSDGSIAMNLGGLLTEASVQPENYWHLVLNNRSYACLGGERLVNADATDYAGVARSVGIHNAFSVSSAGELVDALQKSSANHALIVANVYDGDVPKSEAIRSLGIPFDGPENKYRFGRYMEERLGKVIFGPEGY